jgi:hypothetical protein
MDDAPVGDTGVRVVDRIAEIPNSIRNGTEVRLVNARINGSSGAELSS